MAVLWVILVLASTGLRFVQGLPINPTLRVYPHESGESVFDWSTESSLYAALPALALVLAAVGLLFGCTWCYRHKDCKPNEGADNQLFTASVTHLHDARRSQPPDSGFSEPVNNNISEDNNNGPISLREMQNIANNNAAAYIVSENEERNRISRDSVVEFEPLPTEIRVVDPLERCADWFAGEDFPRNQLQYLREIGRGWFGRVVEGEIEDGPSMTTVAVKILNQNASLEDKARFLDEARLYRDVNHENILGFVAKCLQEDPWILIFELCSMDLQQYLVVNRPKMAILNESGVPLQLMSDVTSALTYMHSRGFIYGYLWSGNVLVRGSDNPRAIIGHYVRNEPQHDYQAPETTRNQTVHTTSNDIWSLGCLVWEVCAWGAPPPASPPPPPDLPCPYRNHLYQVMQLCWNPNPEARPTAAQVHALINHLHFSHTNSSSSSKDDGYASSDFEERWQRLKPNTIPKLDEHIAIVHAPSTSMASHFTGSDQDFDNGQTIQDSLSVEMDTAVSRSSSIMSDRDPLSIQIKSESLTNLHGSLEDVRNIYLTHNETPALECHQGNINLEDSKEKEQDRSDSSVDPWLKDIITDSQDDVSYYKDVSDVIKNLDNILNSEKTSSSESSHQASPSRDNLSLECKKDYPIQKSMVKSPGISNFQNILDMGFDSKSENEPCDDDEGDRDTVGTLSHSFERHSDSVSQQTLENITPETPIKDLDISNNIVGDIEQNYGEVNKSTHMHSDLPKESRVDSSSVSDVPKLKELCVASMPSVSDNEQVILKQDCQTSYDNKITDIRTGTDTKSVEISTAFISNEIGYIENENFTTTQTEEQLEKINSLSSEMKLPTDVARVTKEPLKSLVNQGINNTNTNETNELNKCHLSANTTCDDEVNEINSIYQVSELVSSYTDSTDNFKSETVATEMQADILIDKKLNDLPEETHADIAVVSSNAESSHSENMLEKFQSPLSKFDEITTNAYTVLPSISHNLLPESCNDENNIRNDSMDVVKSNLAYYDNILPIINKDSVQKQEDKLIIQHEIGKERNEAITHKPEPTTEAIADSNLADAIDHCNINEDLIKTDISQSNHTTRENIVDSFKDVRFDVSDSKSDRKVENMEVIKSVTNHLENIETTEQPETVQNYLDISHTTSHLDVNNEQTLESIKPEEVQNSDDNVASISQNESSIVEDVTFRVEEVTKSRSDTNETDTVKHNDNTVYMDLMNDTDSTMLKDSSIDNNLKQVIQSCLETSNSEAPCALVKNESTVYLDLPSIMKETDDFLQSEKSISSQHIELKDNMCTSTPKGSDPSVENTLEPTNETDLSETKIDFVPYYGPGVTLTKLEQKYVPDNMSPFESPSKSHHTDTYDENSSVVLGSFENCNLDQFKVVKSVPELGDLPKEELLAFSSNFSEMNLETPSPLRDSNFLNEVPDIATDEWHFDDIASISETKPESQTPINTDETEEQSSTEKRVSPLTPPNSPGNFLASTSQQKYLVDIDIDSTTPTQESVDLNQIDLQITTKLAMADNENNMNIEYSGPLTEEGITLDDTLITDNDAIPESYLAGNGGSEDVGEDLVIDEERMKELRNELELKLPLAQVAGIEPAVPAEGEWSELPPPPELVLTYGALSPIAEETRMQLNAYENDDQWNISIRTESSASYPEPCNNSTDEVTDLPTGANTAPQQSHSTYTIHSKDNSINHTYTIQKDGISSKEITMSADSLNASPLKKIQEIQSPIDDKTYNKNDEEKESNCERLSQVSPYLLSPTTDTSAPEMSDNAIGLSTFSKTTVPTDAKSSKPSETQCLSKATSIDSWCSNDTLYNVEENFDDLAMDPDCPMDFEEKDKSESEDTLTHNDDEKEASHCSTYIIHDSKSEIGETFSPDSITANDNYTYTKLKTDIVTPSVVTKSDINDSTKSQTKDLAYGTLMSGLPSYSNCTTELASGMDDPWKLPQPELVRRSPVGDDFNFTPPNQMEKEEMIVVESPQTTEPRIKKMDSVEITCLKDDSAEINKSGTSDSPAPIEVNDSPNVHFRNMANSVTSTPFFVTVQDTENVEPIPMDLPQSKADNSESISSHVPNFQTFFQSAEIRPQDISPNMSNEANTEILLEGESNTLSRDNTRDISTVKTPTYSDFESSAVTKPQDVHSRDKSSQSVESGVSSEDFRNFENSVKNRPQDLSSLIDASSLLLKSERKSSELLMTNADLESMSQSDSQVVNTQPESLIFSPNIRNLFESQTVFLTDLEREEETEQPHSIIITESPLMAAKVSPNRTFDSHTKVNRADINSTYDSHASGYSKNVWQTDSTNFEKVNGHSKTDNLILDYLEKDDTESFTISVEKQEKKEQDSLLPDNERVVQQTETPVSDEKFPDTKCNGSNEMFATVNFLNETFEELMESNVDDNDLGLTDFKDEQGVNSEKTIETESESIKPLEESKTSEKCTDVALNGAQGETQMASVTDDFLQNEKKYCQLDSYFPLLSDIRFTGPATEIMTTSFTQDSPTEPTSPECEQDSKPDPTADILKEWDSDSDSHTTNSSSGEFIWKQRDSGSQPSGTDEGAGEGEAPSSGSGDSASGSEGDEVEFVPSSWDCRAAPSKSSLRSMEQPQDNKKRVVFKRQKYHCVYEYPREAPDPDADSPAYLPDFSTYSEWDPSSAEEAELGYGQLFGASTLDLLPLRAGIAFGADYDEDFFISSSARPFESLGVMSTTSQFFPGMHIKPSLERDFPDELSEDFPPPPSPLPPTTLVQTRTPSLDFTTPDSGVEDITPGSVTDDDYKNKKLPDSDTTSWRSIDSASSSESVSPSSPGGEALGGLRHTRDKLKLDLPPSPHIPSPRHSRVFNFVLDKPKRQREEKEAGTTPLVMTDETPIITMTLPTAKETQDDIMPEPTFSTFGKSAQSKPSQSTDSEKNIILTDDVEEQVPEVKEETSKDPVKGEGTVLDSGDEDSGIESSSKATLERKPTPNLS
ncbi:unnamed protein product, partial [Brenthis ino]